MPVDHLQQSAPPLRPLMLWDGDCGFCGRSARRLERWTGSAIDFAPYQQARIRFPEISEAALAQAVHLVDVDGRVYRAAESVFRALAVNPRRAWLHRLYRRSGVFRAISEWVYRLVANNRHLISKVI